MAMQKREQPPEKIAALREAVDDYENAKTSAELALARAEQAMVEAIKRARTAPHPLNWTTIADVFGVTHQAILSKWGTKLPYTRGAFPETVLPSEPTETNERSTK